VTVLRIEHGVRDYEAWKRAFDGDPVGREQGGVRGYRIFRSASEPNRVAIDLEFDSTDAAEGFERKLRELWSRVEAELGLEDRRTSILEVAESGQY
jgi:hypothetical protein